MKRPVDQLDMLLLFLMILGTVALVLGWHANHERRIAVLEKLYQAPVEGAR